VLVFSMAYHIRLTSPSVPPGQLEALSIKTILTDNRTYAGQHPPTAIVAGPGSQPGVPGLRLTWSASGPATRLPEPNQRINVEESVRNDDW
jgi:hypothetical protein